MAADGRGGFQRDSVVQIVRMQSPRTTHVRRCKQVILVNLLRRQASASLVCKYVEQAGRGSVSEEQSVRLRLLFALAKAL